VAKNAVAIDEGSGRSRVLSPACERRTADRYEKEAPNRV